MTNDNLPRGVSESDIPGNRPEDVEWEEFYEDVDAECGFRGLTPSEAKHIWRLGMIQYKGHDRVWSDQPVSPAVTPEDTEGGTHD